MDQVKDSRAVAGVVDALPGYGAYMTEVLIEENFVHIDGTDMNVILTMLDGLNLEAEPTAPRHVSEARSWVIALHWLGSGPITHEVAVALPGVLVEIRDYFVARGKLPPTRIAVYGPDEQLLRSIEAAAA
ncbi:hypothetical protein ABIA32_003827 [Streptacidiphilus sp. MAP12-20]|uniref:hypothetical protein n=1 Tax=Streptacidiphilus sp. MAP12-20 TaxID=3156299 RepID=UPI003516F820